MLSILETEPSLTPQAEPPADATEERAEFEIVLGRAQVASWLFMAVIALAVCSSLAYLAGRSAAPRKAMAAAAVTSAAIPAPAPAAAPAVASSPAALPADILPAAVLPTVSVLGPAYTAPKTAPLFAEPDAGRVYVQIGAVEKGMATILAEGLRSHGFQAFVASGPSENIFRVLIGPLPNPESFGKAKAAVDSIDLAALARRYEK